MALQRLSNSICSHHGLVCQSAGYSQTFLASHRAAIHFSASLSKDLTEGSSTTEAATSGFQKLRHNMANLFVGGRKSDAEDKDEDKIDKEKSPEAHPFPDERRGSIYVQAQWQDGGVVHDVRPHGQGISLSNDEEAKEHAEAHVASA